jgi:hypothetical protein
MPSKQPHVRRDAVVETLLTQMQQACDDLADVCAAVAQSSSSAAAAVEHVSPARKKKRGTSISSNSNSSSSSPFAHPCNSSPLHPSFLISDLGASDFVISALNRSLLGHDGYAACKALFLQHQQQQPKDSPCILRCSSPSSSSSSAAISAAAAAASSLTQLLRVSRRSVRLLDAKTDNMKNCNI